MGPLGYNEIFPGWVLSDNLFTLVRNEEKFKTRQQQKQKQQSTISLYHSEIFREEIIRLIVVARDVLRSVISRGRNGVYSDEIAGIGKNYITESSRLKAIDTYTNTIRWYALRAFYHSCIKGMIVDDDQYGLSLLKIEGLDISQPRSLLKEFVVMDHAMSASCTLSKGKDDVRGEKIIGPIYSEFHQTAGSHPVCVFANKRSEEIEIAVDRIISKL